MRLIYVYSKTTLLVNRYNDAQKSQGIVYIILLKKNLKSELKSYRFM